MHANPHEKTTGPKIIQWNNFLSIKESFGAVAIVQVMQKNEKKAIQWLCFPAAELPPWLDAESLIEFRKMGRSERRLIHSKKK